MKRQILSNVLSNYAGRGVAMVLGFFLVPFLVLKLGVEVFGLIVVFDSLMKLMESASTSIRMALSRYATFALSQDKTEEFEEYLSTGRGLFWIVSLLALVFGFLVSFWIPDIFRLPAGRHQECQRYFALVTVAFALTIPNAVFWSGLYAKQRFDLINLANSAGIILRAIVIFIVFSVLPQEKLSLVTYGGVYLGMTWAQNLAVFLIFKKLMPSIRISIRSFRKDKVRGILSFSAFTLSGRLTSLIHENVINLMVNLLWGPAANALYGVGAKFAYLVDSIFLEPTWTLTPTFTDLVAKKENERLKALLFLYTKVIAVVCVPLCLVLIVFSRPILMEWVGPDFSDAVMIMIVSLLPHIVYIPVAVCNTLPNAFGRVKLPGIVGPVNDIVSLGVCYLFAVPLKFGILGVVMGTSLMAVLVNIVCGVPYGCHLAGFSVAEYWWQAYLKPLALAAVLWVPSLLGLLSWRPVLWESVPGMASLLTMSALYAAAVYFLVLTARERDYLRGLIKR